MLAMYLLVPIRNPSTPYTFRPFDFYKHEPRLTPDDEELRQRWSSLIGIVTAIVGNILISFALNIQRLAHIKLLGEQGKKKEILKNSPSISFDGSQHAEDTQDSGECGSFRKVLQRTPLSKHQGQDDSLQTNYLKSPYWWGGIALMTIGEAGNFLAYGFAPASIVSPLGVVALISNCVIAPILLKEKFRSRDFWGVVVAVTGAVTVVLSAKQEERKLGPQEIWASITAIEFQVYVIVTISLIGVLVWASSKYGSRIIIIDLGLVGLLGGYTALSTKGIASMLSSTLWRALTTPITYGLLIIMVGTAVMQVKYVNRALQRFDSTQVIPVQFVTFTLSVIIGSGILYRDFEKTTPESASKFFGGCLLTFMGVRLITSGRPPLNEEQNYVGETNNQGLEERINQLSIDGAFPGESINSQVGYLNNGQTASFINKSEISERKSVDPLSRPSIPHIYSEGSSHVSSGSYDEETPLLRNAGKFSEQVLRARHLEIQAASPTPTTFTIHTLLSEPVTPLQIAQPISQDRFHLHPPVLLLGLKSGALRSPIKRSSSHLIPGPLISPLSGGLSGAVVDSLRRGANSSLRCKKQINFHNFLRKSQSGSLDIFHPKSTEDEPPVSPTKGNEDTSYQFSMSLEDGERRLRTRTRSLSNTLEGLLRGIGRKADTEELEEAGPSGL